MQLFGPTGSRSQWEDRNPTRVNDANFTDLAGSATFDLVVYTVPANRRARLLHGFLFGVVTTALAAAQTADVRMETESPGPAILEMMMLHFRAAAALGTTFQESTNGLYLVAGDVLRFRASAAAGAGVIRVTMGYNLIEYDA